MVKKWPRVTLVHAPTIAALWLLDAQFVNRYHIHVLKVMSVMVTIQYCRLLVVV